MATRCAAAMDKYILDNWPLIYKDDLILLNKKKSIAIGCMWTPKDIIKEYLEKHDLIKHINLIGNTYSINAPIGMIINILSNRYIGHIIITGDIISYKNIVDRIMEIFNGDSELEYADTYNKYLKELRKQIISCKYVAIEEIQSYITALCKKSTCLNAAAGSVCGAFYDKPPIDVKDELTIIKESSYFPSNISGYSISCFDGDIFNAFLDICRLILSRGYEIDNTREIQNLTITMHKLDLSNLCSIPYITPEQVQQYKDDMIKPKISQNSYSYGSLLSKQTNYIINILGTTPFTRQAYVPLFDESFYGNDNPPCAVSTYFKILKTQLHMTVTFRSNDMFKAWALNVIGFREYQEMICRELNRIYNLNYTTGLLTTIGFSSHIYKNDFNICNTLLKTYSLIKTNIIPEPEGYYLIDIPDQLDDKIRVKLFSNDHEFIKEWINSNYDLLIQEVVSNINNPMHAAYVVKEIMEKKYTLHSV